MNHGEGISSTLLRLGIIQKSRTEVLSEDTRDVKGLKVYRDKVSRVVFIDDHYVGDQVYQSGDFRKDPKPLMSSAGRDFEDLADTERRAKAYQQFYVAKDICDFGCGAGSFLRRVKPYVKNAAGVELNQTYSEKLNSEDILCRSEIETIPFSLDSVFLFHSFEHLPTPTEFLKRIKSKLKPDGNGTILIEVPHARDFLIETLDHRPFINFTLWSQHLILHTRESLTAFLQDAGFRNITIEGVQRYSLSNHLHWLKNSRPGGHKSTLSLLETETLRASYADALSKIDANDTLVAVAST